MRCHRTGLIGAFVLTLLHFVLFSLCFVFPNLNRQLEFRINAIVDFQFWRLLTGPFVVGPNFLQALWFMTFLFLFSQAVGKWLGGVVLFLFYLAGTVVVSTFLTVGLWSGFVPNHLVGEALYSIPTGIASLFSLYLCRTPNGKFWLGRMIPVPGWLLVMVYLTVDLRFFSWENWPVALPAYLSGLLVALTYLQFFGVAPCQQTKEIPDVVAKPSLSPEADPAGAPDYREQWFDPSFGPGATAQVSTEALASTPPAEEDRPERNEALFDTKVDQVLAKISHLGPESLSPDEQRILQRASQLYRIRRGRTNPQPQA